MKQHLALSPLRADAAASAGAVTDTHHSIFAWMEWADLDD
jgi:hypothetical protein